MEKTNLYGLSLQELGIMLSEAGFKQYNGRQIFEWMYQKNIRDFGLMTNLSLKLREYLSDHFGFGLPGIATIQNSSDGTRKYLFAMNDGSLIETVLMTHDYGYSVCVSSQVGCNMKCAFCASGLKNKIRNLDTAELVGQVIMAGLEAKVRITNVVVMGTGEPFDNYENVIKFIGIINESKGLAIGQRHITVSTSGIVPMIRRYAEEPIRSNLAVSLHASDDTLRNRLMPINRKYPVAEVIRACKDYFEKTSRRVTFEYILLKGVNDSLEQANKLADLLRDVNCYVNLIPYNPVDEFEFDPSGHDATSIFLDCLMKRKINVTMRKEQGGDIDAACGQLRMKSKTK
ncbi:MAG TPA: 23S rRNA (adenine(2503)-C(2))-methyltransferase RlmN [Bacillota bacterium]|nr:23S rRNA (adenine(2503)-C(2))-methyltransferase RlmN [Bacillota bacterium]HPF41886.1 23S rRNA (adenine(2503)-C(2))-methyltransferase RlmN [Bacillota bacterium]HPJ85641.1 23S rRNA (adenine(2503)-C(2))-methyltransferase RlmN [Bacillota bacterium]HPQ61407.1 23S rRNA (adenine(2503)-C(2))-methyltransferase RlmN [Bacillota bacterium]HRX91295.1 23S rRNA (adenine(2503)-C(2))-methyltransferase RlmN [Candidatus Izemoplasmatales bacterium]